MCPVLVVMNKAGLKGNVLRYVLRMVTAVTLNIHIICLHLQILYMFEGSSRTYIAVS